MLARGDTFDVAYLFSGDSDFKRVIDLLQSRGKRVFVVSSRGSLSREFIHTADKPLFFMGDFREQLRREQVSALNQKAAENADSPWELASSLRCAIRG